jgi:hypothetical protein
MLFFNLEVLKGKPTKSIWIMAHLKLSKRYVFGTKNLKKKTKIAIHMDLWKYGQIWTIQKTLTIKWLMFSKKKNRHMSLSYCIWSYIESQ